MTSHHIHQGAAVDHGICVKLFQSEEGEGVRNVPPVSSSPDRGAFLLTYYNNITVFCNIVPQQFYTTYLQIMKITLYLN